MSPGVLHARPSQTRRRKPAKKSARLDLARLGERRAENYLSALGYRIIAKNWRSPETRNELDLIVEDGGCLVFVEVKTARTVNYGDPITWITPRKQMAIVRAATSYLVEETPIHDEFRFDTITIAASRDNEEAPLVHTKSAFIAE